MHFNYKKIVFLFLVIIIWNYISNFFNPIILPSPFEVISKTYEIMTQKSFLSIIYKTIFRTIIGAVISLVIGVLIGLLMGINKDIEQLFLPFVTILQATPVISWLVLALIWFENEYIPFIVVSVSTISIPINNTIQGIKSADKKLVEMAELFNVSKKKIYFDIYLNSIIRYLISAIKIIIGLAFKIGVMGEVISKAGGGIGERLNWAWINIETAEVISWTVIIITISYIFDKLYTNYIIEVFND